MSALSFAQLREIAGDRTDPIDAPCPLCAHLKGHNARKRTLRVWPLSSPGLVSYHCARCSSGGYVVDGGQRRSLSREEREVVELAATEARKRDRLHRLQRHKLALRLWGEGVDIRDTLAERYLVEHRGHDVRGLNLDHLLRWNRHDQMMVALMTDAVSNAPCGIHRTFLDAEGRKTQRKMLGQKGVLRVSADDEVHYGLGICEGLEDALAIILGGWQPVWACGDKGGIASFPILPGIDCLTIHSDRGPGEAEAEACARRWHEAGREVLVVLPGGTP